MDPLFSAPRPSLLLVILRGEFAANGREHGLAAIRVRPGPSTKPDNDIHALTEPAVEYLSSGLIAGGKRPGHFSGLINTLQPGIDALW